MILKGRISLNNGNPCLTILSNIQEELTIEEEFTGKYVISGFQFDKNKLKPYSFVSGEDTNNYRLSAEYNQDADDGSLMVKIETINPRNNVSLDSLIVDGIIDSIYFEVEQVEYYQYTDTELSAISHAKSILYRAGLKNLAELL